MQAQNSLQRSSKAKLKVSSSENLAENLLSELEADRIRCNPICPETLQELEKEGVRLEKIDNEYIYFSYPVRSSRPVPTFRGSEQAQYKVAQEAIKQIVNLKLYKREQLAKEITDIVRVSANGQ